MFLIASSFFARLQSIQRQRRHSRHRSQCSQARCSMLMFMHGENTIEGVGLRWVAWKLRISYHRLQDAARLNRARQWGDRALFRVWDRVECRNCGDLGRRLGGSLNLADTPWKHVHSVFASFFQGWILLAYSRYVICSWFWFLIFLVLSYKAQLVWQTFLDSEASIHSNLYPSIHQSNSARQSPNQKTSDILCVQHCVSEMTEIETCKDEMHEMHEKSIESVNPSDDAAEPVPRVQQVPTGPTVPAVTVPKLTSRKHGGLITWVVDRRAMSSLSPGAKSPSPKSRSREESPETPSFKPSLPRRQDMKDPISESDPKDQKCPVEDAQMNGDEAEAEQSNSGISDACEERTETNSLSNGPCSSSEDESNDEGSQKLAGYQGYGYGVPVWTVYFPVTGTYLPNWFDVNEYAAQHLDACRKVALQNAEKRGAPTDEICCVGCCCSRCIGLPSAFAPKHPEKNQKSEETSPKIVDGNSGVENCDAGSVQSQDAQDTVSTTSMSSDSSDSDVDVEEVLKNLPCRSLKWTTGDHCLQQTLTTRRNSRTVVCTNLDWKATAEDVQKAFELRFLSLPGFVDEYLKTGVAEMGGFSD